jgi:hypothetical protein
MVKYLEPSPLQITLELGDTFNTKGAAVFERLSSRLFL